MSSGHDLFRGPDPVPNFTVARSSVLRIYAARLATHYDVLGVPSDASPAAIRTAYHQRARLLHPDRTGDGGEGAASMAAVNEAYRVLCEPGSRALYDRSLDQPTPTESHATETGVDSDWLLVDTPRRHPSRLSPEGPARVPWKPMLVAAVLGSAIVLFTASFNDPPSIEPPDGIIRAGSCVEIESNGDAREVACSNTSSDIVVSLLLPTGATCPVTMSAHRDRLGLGTACIPFD